MSSTFENCRDVTVWTELPSGARAIVPLADVRRGRFRRMRSLLSSYAGCYGGIIADGPVTDSERMGVYNALREMFPFSDFRVLSNPLRAGVELIGPYAATEDYFTQLIDLSAGYERIFAGFTKKNRERVRRALREGVVVRVATGAQEYAVAYDAYKQCLTRWGQKATNRYPSKLFENAHRLSVEFPDHIKLWVAERQNKILATALLFYWNHHAVIWLSSSYEEYFKLSPNNVLRAGMIRDACERGYRYFDFNPSGGHEGVVKFKESFGGYRQPLQSCVFAGLYHPVDRIGWGYPGAVYRTFHNRRRIQLAVRRRAKDSRRDV